MFPIEHPKVREYYLYLNDCFHDPSIDKKIRKNAKRKMEIIEVLVSAYEGNHEITDEDIEDLKLVSSPLFPEDYEKYFKK